MATPDHDPGGTESVVPSQKPLLASEALKDDIAPIQPLDRAARIWAAAGGLWLAGTHVIAQLIPAAAEVLGGTGLVAAVIGVVAIAAGALPLPYLVRAGAMLLVAIAVAALGLTGIGPASVATAAVGPWGLGHWLAAVMLPAALIFRTRYRAYSGARRILATSLLLAMPFAVRCALALSEPHVEVQLAAAAALLALALGLLGFMGWRVSIPGDYLACAIVAAVTGELACEAIVGLPGAASPTGLAPIATAAVSFAAASTLGALGAFQLLAARHWDAARAFDVRKVDEPPRPPSPSLTETWSTRK